MNTEIIMRVTEMERLYDEVSLAVRKNGGNIPHNPELTSMLRTLTRYMDSGLWLKDYEADDLIGAAVKNSSLDTAIISSDKDLSQLIDDHCVMFIPARSGGGFEVRDSEETLKKFAVTPDQIVDYLALLGDSSDAIEGVPGIGPKTAANILNS